MQKRQSGDHDRAQIEKLAWFLDESIRLPGGFRIGWDGLIGLIPGVGDVAGLLASGYVIMLAARQGASRFLLARMCMNTLVETVIGSIPLFGDLFDFFFKANSRNLRLLQRHHNQPRQTRTTSALVVTGTIVFFLLIVVLVLWLLVSVLSALLSLIF